MLVGPIEVVSRFEGGGLGELLRCRDAQGVGFAAKFPKDFAPESQQLLDDEERRFRRHQGQHVVRYYGSVVHTDGRRGFAMELMAGSLSGLVRDARVLPPARALKLFRQVAQGLAEVHASAPGAFHGDIKLANVLVHGEIAKLADFGLARGGVGQTIHVGAHQGGTPGYLPPERMTSPMGDVYSLGVMLWAMLAGREPHPQQGPNLQLALRPALHELLHDMLQSDPHHRPNIHQVLARLSAVEAEAASALPVATAPALFAALGCVMALGLAMAGVCAFVSLLFGDEGKWDPSVGRYRGPDGRFMPD